MAELKTKATKASVSQFIDAIPDPDRRQDCKALLDRLGAHSSGVGCLYLKSLDDIHKPTLQKLITDSVKRLRKIAKEKARG